MGDEQGWAALNDENRQIWNTNAEWWDDRIGDGNAFQDELVEPTQLALLGDLAGKRVLDIGCGAGRFSRRRASLGAHVVAFDFSERFIARARERTPEDMETIEFHVADATDRDQLLAFGPARFDAAVSTMCLMDVADIGPLIGTLPTLLGPAGHFVFSIIHPCFHSAPSEKFAEMGPLDSRFRVRNGVKVFGYLTPTSTKAEGIIGQPELQYYFHRPLSGLLRTAFENGFVLDGYEEPRLQNVPANKEYLRWRHMPDIPPVLIVRLRLAECTS